LGRAKIAMNQLKPEKSCNTCIFHAPLPSHPAIEPSIYWLEVPEGYSVEWQWTQLPDGHRVVTGYQIIKDRERES
jgi:hypothetical protein